MIVFGLVAIAAMLTLKGGIWGVIQRRFDLRLFPVQRRVRLAPD